MKITIGDTDGNTHQTEIEDAARLVGTKVGEEFDGGIVGAEGYTLQITGGSDKDGFPMRRSVEGSERRKMLLAEGPGVRTQEGIRTRKSVRGNTVSTEIEQLNTKVVESGSKSLEEVLGEGEEE